jgi:hypothetical protein
MNSILKKSNLLFELQCDIGLITLEDIAIVAHDTNHLSSQIFQPWPTKVLQKLNHQRKYIIKCGRQYTNYFNTREDGNPLPLLDHI